MTAKKKFIMTRGLPGSGKSTWADEQILFFPAGSAVRVNMDTIRIMLHADRFAGKSTENLTQSTRDLLLRSFMQTGIAVVISDDTNFDPRRELAFRSLADEFGYMFEVKDFTDVPVEVCIQRDLKRAKSVGEKVIRKMWRKYLESPHNRVEPPPFVPGKKSAVIVDIDGTVALMDGRSPYDPSRYHTDKQNAAVVKLVQDLREAREEIVFCSGRDDTYRDSTEAWLIENVGFCDHLFMRPGGDTRKDAIVKRELYDANIAGKFNVRFVLDDRDQVVEMWRGLGLTCLQVAPGNF